MKNVKVTTVLVIESTWTEEDFVKIDTHEPDSEEFATYTNRLKNLSHDELTEVVRDCWDGLSVFEYNTTIVHEVKVGEE